MFRNAQALNALLLLFASTIYAATPTSGTIRGVVRDSTGAVLPGVRVEVAGPTSTWLATMTDDRGEYAFALLAPGTSYEVSAHLHGFETVRYTSVRVPLGRESILNITLQPSTSDEVVVTAARPLIDMRDTSSSTNISSDTLRALPTTRDFQYLVSLAPGIVLDAENEPLSPRIGGASHLENDYIIEGISTRDPRTGQSVTNVTVDFVREIQVMTGEFPAEYGRATGGIINVVTESGTNQLVGSLLSYYGDSSWASEAPKRTFRGVTTYEPGRDKWDLGGALSGPIVRDRAWFFLSYDRRRSEAALHLVDDEFDIDRHEQVTNDEHMYIAKATVALTSSQSLTLTGFGNPTEDSGWLSEYAPMTPESALGLQTSGTTNATIRHEAILSPAWSMETSLGRHRREEDYTPTEPGAEAAPTQWDTQPNPWFGYGGSWNKTYAEAARDSFSMRGSRFSRRHNIRFGGDYEKNRYEDVGDWTEFYFDGPWDFGGEIGVADSLWEYTTHTNGWGTNDITSLFAQDSWLVTPRVNLNLGLRWEQQELSSSRGAVLAVGRSADGTIIRKQANSVTIHDNWAPRFGISVDPSGNGTTKLYAAAGRYYEAIPVHINVRLMNGYGVVFRQYYSPTTHEGTSWVNPQGSPVNDDWVLLEELNQWNGGYDENPTPIDPNMQLQYQDEYSLGVETQLGRNWVVGARYVNRTLENVIEDHFVVGPDGEGVDWVVSNVGTGLYGSEFRKPTRKYQAVELTLQKRMSNNWMLASSFVHAKSEGDHDGLYDYTNAQNGAHATHAIEFPSWQTNSYGRLRGDVPYQFKIHGAYSFPFGLTLSEGFVYSAGVPISATIIGYPWSGIQSYYVLPRGSAGRTPDYHQLDLHADWQFPIGAKGLAMSVILDALNVTAQDEALYVNQAITWRRDPGYRAWTSPDNLDENGAPMYNPDLPVSEFYKEPRSYQAPRTFQLGVKLTF